MPRSDGALAARSRPARATERELVLAARSSESGSREELVEAFMPLIGSVARLYRGATAVDRVELMQEGVVGLLRALERYDPELGTPFWAYASWWVRQAMQQLVAELTRPVVLSDRALRQLACLKDTRQCYVRDHGREPTLAELTAQSGLSVQQVQSLTTAERRPRGLEEPIGGPDETGGTFGDLVVDPCAEDAFDEVPLRLGIEDLPEMLDCLGERERLIVRARFGLDGEERTLRDLAEDLGVSAERVRQLEQGALEKLRADAAAPKPRGARRRSRGRRPRCSRATPAPPHSPVAAGP
jgi:RNA polymerase sigma factor (sigma-70 family)